MKKVFAIICTMMMVVGLLAACGSSENNNTTTAAGGGDAQTTAAADTGEVFKLKIDYPNPENSVVYPCLVQWADWMREQSGGRIDATVYSGGALGNIADCVTNVESGVTDGCWCTVSLYPGIWPLTDVFMLPMMGTDNIEAWNATMNEIMKKEEFQKEYSNVHMLCLHTGPGYPYLFADDVDSVQAMVGKTFRTASSFTTPWLEALGAVPVSVSSNDGYENFQKGVIAAGMYDNDKIESSALYEVIKTAIYGESAQPCLFLCLNKEVYESMPADLQKVVDDSAAYYLSLLPQGYEDQKVRVAGYLSDANVKVLDLTPEDAEWLRAQAQKGYDVYLGVTDKMGYDGQALIDEIQALLEENDK